jgi:predicted secreted protein
MRLLSILALITTTAVLTAQDFDFKGVPADYTVTFATSGTSGLKISDSPEAKAWRDRMEKSLKERSAKDGSGPMAGMTSSKEVQAAFKAATGIDMESHDNRFAGGFVINDEFVNATRGSSEKFTGGLIFRGHHDSKKLAAYAAGKKVTSIKAGTTQGWQALEFLRTFGSNFDQVTAQMATAAGPKSEPFAIFDLDDETIVIAQPQEAARMIALLKGKGKSYTLPSALNPQLVATGRPYMVLAFDAAKMAPSKALTDSGFQGGLFAMGEKSSDQIMKISTYFTSKEKAAPMAMQAQGMMAMLPMMLAGDPRKPQSEADKEMKAVLGELLAGIQPIEAVDSQITLTAKWDTVKLLGIIEKLMPIVDAQAKAAKDAQAKALPKPVKK